MMWRSRLIRGCCWPIGCLDMTGNTWEWTSDWDGSLVSSRGAVLDNPAGPDDGSMKIIKGGSWDSEPVTVEPTKNRPTGSQSPRTPCSQPSAFAL